MKCFADECKKILRQAQDDSFPMGKTRTGTVKSENKTNFRKDGII